MSVLYAFAKITTPGIKLVGVSGDKNKSWISFAVAQINTTLSLKKSEETFHSSTSMKLICGYFSVKIDYFKLYLR